MQDFSKSKGLSLKKRGLIARAWFGEEQLGTVFWTYCVGFNLIFMFILGIIGTVLIPEKFGMAIIIPICLFIPVLFYWQVVSIWRCAKNSKLVWKVFARTLLVLFLIAIIGNIAAIAIPTYNKYDKLAKETELQNKHPELYSIDLVKRKYELNPPSKWLQSIADDMVIVGWNSSRIENKPNSYLVSYTFMFSDDPGTQVGWWWEVNIKEKTILKISGKPIPLVSVGTSLLKSNWRLIRKGMSESDIRNILGEPVHIKSWSIYIIWEYYYGGTITFRTVDNEPPRLDTWDEPSFFQ